MFNLQKKGQVVTSPNMRRNKSPEALSNGRCANRIIFYQRINPFAICAILYICVVRYTSQMALFKHIQGQTSFAIYNKRSLKIDIQLTSFYHQNYYYIEISIQVVNQIFTNKVCGRLITSCILVTPLLKIAWINLMEKMSSFHD